MEDKRARSGKHKTPRALFSVPERDWEDFGKAIGETNRAAVLRAFIAWFLRRPGARLPTRPAAAEPPHDAASGT